MVEPSRVCEAASSSVVFVTGAAGVGKTSIMTGLRDDVDLDLVDIDDYFPERIRDDKWRTESCQAFLSEPRNGRRRVLFGQVPPHEILRIFNASGLGGAPVIIRLVINEDERRQRLLLRGWSEADIAHHRRWATLNNLLPGPFAFPIVDIDMSDVTIERAAAVLTAALAGDDHNTETGAEPADTGEDGTIMPASGLTIDEVRVSSKLWQEELPKAESYQDIVDTVKRSPADNYYDVYHPLPFPELDAIQTAVDKWQFRRKSKIILDVVESIRAARRAPAAALKVVDIGANSGGISFAFALAGYDVRAVEPDPRYHQLTRAVERISGVRIDTRQGNMEHAIDAAERFDVCILLSVFQWAAQGGAAIETAGAALRDVSSRCEHMIFEQGFNKGTSCFTTSNPDHYQELLVMLTRYTVYTDFTLLPATELYPGQTRYLIHCSGRR